MGATLLSGRGGAVPAPLPCVSRALLAHEPSEGSFLAPEPIGFGPFLGVPALWVRKARFLQGPWGRRRSSTAAVTVAALISVEGAAPVGLSKGGRGGPLISRSPTPFPWRTHRHCAD